MKKLKNLLVAGVIGIYIIATCGNCVSADSPKKSPDQANTKRKLLLSEDFQKNPLQEGWTYEPPKKGKAKKNSWHKTGYIQSAPQRAKWFGPKLPVTPFSYYKLAFKSQGESKGYWATFFYTESGTFITADVYGSVYRSDRWRSNVTMVRAREHASSVTPNFQGRKGLIKIDDVQIASVSSQSVLKWADQLYQKLPPLEYKPEPNRWRHIPKTIKRLKTGAPMRIVMLGDSIINDTSNSNYEVLVRRMYPKANFVVITSVRGGTGCGFYQKKEHFKGYVIDRKPDLLMIGGISQGIKTLDAIRKVIRMAKKKIQCEIMLITGPMGRDWRKFAKDDPTKLLEEPDYFESKKTEKLREKVRAFRKLAAEEKVGFFDMATAWHLYLANSGKPHGWFHRDRIHANNRGKQILGRLLASYFSSKN